MSDPMTPARQHDPSLCPPWCSGDHLRTGLYKLEDGYYHDQEAEILTPVEQPTPDAGGLLFVKASQHVAHDGTPSRVFVEVLTERTTIGLLTPDEVRALARVLNETADVADPPAVQVLRASRREVCEELARRGVTDPWGVAEGVCPRWCEMTGTDHGSNEFGEFSHNSQTHTIDANDGSFDAHISQYVDPDATQPPTLVVGADGIWTLDDTRRVSELLLALVREADRG
jgi:hypothetical protein